MPLIVIVTRLHDNFRSYHDHVVQNCGFILTKIIMVVSGLFPWNFLSWFGAGEVELAGDDPFQVTQESSLISLPPEIRTIIFKKLSPSDHKNMRQVCQILKFDIEQNVGIHAILEVPELTSWVNYTIYGYVSDYDAKQELEGLQSNINWIKRVHVQQLKARRLGRVEFTIPSTLLTYPFVLKKLTLSFDDDGAVGKKVLDIIKMCPGLKKLTITSNPPNDFLAWYHDPRRALDWTEVENYNKMASQFFEELFTYLSTRPNLKRLRIVTQAIRNPDSRNPHITRRLHSTEFYLALPPNNIAEDMAVPRTLQSLKLTLPQYRDVLDPYRLPNQMSLWKHLLDSQVQLTKLQVKVGAVYWRFFENVLRNCYHTLKSLEIHVGNWIAQINNHVILDPWNWIVVQDLFDEISTIPERNWMDWTILFTENCNLESLAIRMPPRAHVSANLTKNLCRTFDKLKNLELRYVKLSQPQLRWILLDLPALKSVFLEEWYSVHDRRSNFMIYKNIFEETFQIITESLQHQRLDSLKMRGKLISGMVYSDYVGFRQSVTDPNYVISWRQSTGNFRRDIGTAMKHTLVITRKAVQVAEENPVVNVINLI